MDITDGIFGVAVAQFSVKNLSIRQIKLFFHLHSKRTWSLEITSCKTCTKEQNREVWPSSVIFVKKSSFFNSCQSLIQIQLSHLQASIKRIFSKHLLRFNPASNGKKKYSSKKSCGLILPLVKSAIFLRLFSLSYFTIYQNKGNYRRTEAQHKQYYSQGQADTVINSLLKGVFSS